MSPYRLKGTAGAVINRSFPLDRTLVLGTGPDCDVEVETDRGEAVLATVRLTEEGALRLEAPKTAGVTVNGDPVTEIDLAGGDELRIGRSRFILQAPGLRPERVLTEDATRPRRATWPWWLAGAALLVGAAATAWWQGWLPLP